MNETDMCHFMIDLETLGTKSNSVILSIGVAQFDLRGSVMAVFHRGVLVDSCLKAGLQVDGSTIEWWLKQPKENIERLLNLNCTTLYNALEELASLSLYANSKNCYVWSHGSNFDIVLLENAYKAVGQKIWWDYKNVRDTRTLFDVVNYKYEAKGGHDALEDAISQAKAVCEAYQQLNRRRDTMGMADEVQI